MSKTVFVHIGHYKTGSTAIQTFVSAHTEALAERGFLYPAAGRPSEGSGSVSHCQLSLPLGVAFGSGAPPWYKDSVTPDDVFAALRAEIDAAPQDKVILSSEEFFKLATSRSPKLAVQDLRKRLDGYDVKIVAYIRDPFALLKSWYNEVNKGPVGSLNFPSFFMRLSPAFLAQKPVCDIYSAAFGAENMIFRPYGKRGAEHLRDFFEAVGVSDMPVPDDIAPVQLARGLKRLEAERLAKTVRFSLEDRVLTRLTPDTIDKFFNRVDRINRGYNSLAGQIAGAVPSALTAAGIIGHYRETLAVRERGSEIDRREGQQLRALADAAAGYDPDTALALAEAAVLMDPDAPEVTHELLLLRARNMAHDALPLLEMALPGHRLRLHFLSAPGPRKPWVVYDDPTAPEHVAAGAGAPETVLTVEGGNDRPGARLADIFTAPPELVVHRPQPQVQRRRTLVPRDLRRTMAQRLPMSFELAKYLVERRRLRSPREGRWQRPEGIGAARPLAPAPAPLFAAEGGEPRAAIVIGVHWLEHGGAEKLAFDAVRWALSAGLRVFVVAEHDVGQTLASRLPGSDDVHFLRTDRIVPPELFADFMVTFARSENVRAVHAHHCASIYRALPALRAAIPDLVAIDSTHIYEYRDGGFVGMAGTWTALVDHHHVISHALEHDLTRRWGVAPEKLLLGRMLDRSSEAAPLPPFSLDPASGRLAVAFVGRMSHQKRPLLAINAMRQLARWAEAAGVAISFDIVGEGPYLQYLRPLTERYGIADKVTFHAADTNVPAIMDRADILLLPSANEGLALVGYEAIHHGAMPVSTDVGAQSELIPADLLVAPSPIGFARRVREVVARLWTDGEFRARAGAGLHAGLASLAAEPTAEEVLVPLYREIAARGAAKEEAER